MEDSGDSVNKFPLSDSESGFFTFGQIPEDLRRSIVPLVEMSRTDEGAAVITPIGTAFVIAELPSGQALLATAGHNITEGVQIGGSNLVILLPKQGANLGGLALQGLIVSGVSVAESSSDVALMTTAINDSVARPALIPLSLEIPQVGENCLALGYSELTIGEPTELEANGQIRLSSSRGAIEEVFRSRRDSVKVTYPSFRTDAFYEQGMSGGPVLSSRGGAMGLVSTCMQSNDDEVPHTSHVALTAGLLELTIPEEGDTEVKVADLMHAGRVRVSGERTTVTRSGGIVKVTWPDAGEVST